jgi:hypothetical protein
VNQEHLEPAESAAIEQEACAAFGQCDSLPQPC